jgi:hypothetical protein
VIEGLPALHAAFLANALPILAADARIVGVAAAGSTARPETMDEHSDLDFVVAVEPHAFEAVMGDRERIARSLLHVDLKFVPLPDAAQRVDDNVVLCDRDGRLAATLAGGSARYPQPDLQWMEDRIWTWVFYLAGKIARGELFETLDGLGYIRSRVLGPLALVTRGAQPNGVRRLETAAPDLVESFRRTVAVHDARSCAAALRATIALYRELRASSATPALVRDGDAERESIRFLDAVEESL